MDYEKHYLNIEVKRLQKENQRLNQLLGLKSEGHVGSKRLELNNLISKLEHFPNEINEYYYSQTKSFYFTCELYKKNIQLLNPDSSTFGFQFLYQINIFNNVTKEKLYSFISENSPFDTMFVWLLVDSKEYLFYPEFKTGCQSIFDIEYNIFRSYFDPTSEYWYYKLLPSENGLFMAALFGDKVQILSTENCETLPLEVVNEKVLLSPNSYNPTDAFLDYHWNDIELIISYQERLYAPLVYLPVVIIGILDEEFVTFSFKDIYENIYEACEKQAYFALENYINEQSVLPQKAFLSVITRNIKTIDGRKIYTIIADQIRDLESKYIEIDVSETQISKTPF